MGNRLSFSATDVEVFPHTVSVSCLFPAMRCHRVRVVLLLQDSGSGLLETTLCFEHAEQRTFRTYYVIADNTLGRRAEAVELQLGLSYTSSISYKYRPSVNDRHLRHPQSRHCKDVQ